MPTSDIGSVPAIIHEAYRLQPKRVLDLGAGCGKYGVLLREYLDGAHGRVQRSQWQVEINAVEGWKPYINDLHHAVYSIIWSDDFSSFYPYYTGYDLVLMIDSLEHLDKTWGERVLDTLLKNNKQVIVSVPMGRFYREQGAEFGNEFERHRAKWNDVDFVSRNGRLIHDGVCTVYSLQGRA